MVPSSGDTVDSTVHRYSVKYCTGVYIDPIVRVRGISHGTVTVIALSLVSRTNTTFVKRCLTRLLTHPRRSTAMCLKSEWSNCHVTNQSHQAVVRHGPIRIIRYLTGLLLLSGRAI